MRGTSYVSLAAVCLLLQFSWRFLWLLALWTGECGWQRRHAENTTHAVPDRAPRINSDRQ